jgi:hypothetical protein
MWVPVGQGEDKRVTETAALRKWHLLSSVEHTWMTVLKRSFLISLAMPTNVGSSAEMLSGHLRGTDAVVLADTEHEKQQL